MLGPGIAVLLQKVQELHSLRAAAMSIGHGGFEGPTILKPRSSIWASS